MHNLSTTAKITWCPGCPNSQILVAFRQTVEGMIDSGGLKIENLVACAGIGCHGKISDYLNVNTFTALHGRVVPVMTGIKCGNPNLTVVGFSGDGDSYDEGLEHVIHAARRNSDIKLFIHDNQLFALTTGQASAASPKGFKGKTTPGGSIEEPFDAIPVLLQAGATFVARSYAGDIASTRRVMEAAIKIHEIVELALLKNRNVILSITDDFDIQFEQERSLGKHAPDDEPGDDPRCPYGPEHRFAENIERLFIERAGIRWDDYAARMPQ